MLGGNTKAENSSPRGVRFFDANIDVAIAGYRPVGERDGVFEPAQAFCTLPIRTQLDVVAMETVEVYFDRFFLFDWAGGRGTHDYNVRLNTAKEEKYYQGSHATRFLFKTTFIPAGCRTITPVGQLPLNQLPTRTTTPLGPFTLWEITPEGNPPYY